MDVPFEKENAGLILQGLHRNPFGYLGLHQMGDKTLMARVFLPGCEQVELWSSDRKKAHANLVCFDPEGFFLAEMEGSARFPYVLKVVRYGRESWLEDPYRFGTVLAERDLADMTEGAHWSLYGVLGAHLCRLEGVDGVSFAIWAPQAQAVSVVGDFNSWDARVHLMRSRFRGGIWELFLPGLQVGDPYMYAIREADGTLGPWRTDPIAFQVERHPRKASVIYAQNPSQSKTYLASRQSHEWRREALSIYECSLAAWRKRELEHGPMGEEESNQALIQHVQDMGFSHIQLVESTAWADASADPAQAHFFAPVTTQPRQLQRFLQACHDRGLGVLCDSALSQFEHFPGGLGQLDGTHLYEHQDARQGHHPSLAERRFFNISRHEVLNFLVSSGLYWIKRFGFDGLCVPGLARLLYLDFRRTDWVPNHLGGNIHLHALELLRFLNELAKGEDPSVLSIAGGDAVWPGATRPTYQGGLGFSFQMNDSWFRDVLSYFRKDPIYRRYHHNELIKTQLYAHNEHYILPFGLRSQLQGPDILGLFPGSESQQLAQLRALLTWMWCFPGKKWMAMGTEWAFLADEEQVSLDHSRSKRADFVGLKKLIAGLNRLYRSQAALHEPDTDPNHFTWVQTQNQDWSVYAYLRRAQSGAFLLVVAHFTPVVRPGLRVGVPVPGSYQVIFSSDEPRFGGQTQYPQSLVSQAISADGFSDSICLDVPAHACLVLELKP
ncbi:MAG: 1,4-alpha-glucan branching enzyme [Acidobacteria bacterium]|nr:1,4-alpha-glucan branching enzyme [Acidobacteriota bacterium]MCB9397654.1 1,4-alpha-glucan branching enzyme [Acidobacteriota bacterium]